ncbi:MAG: efflux RND transporter periplasmic adaptor subunit [Fibrella sp.]|nr:efflux RND transporter periplasmic adaptor subunit [Armatimonadota bacterium]
MNPNRNILIGTAVVLTAGVGAWMVTRGNTKPQVTYRTAIVERIDLRKTVSATGFVQPLTTVDIKSRAGGEVKKLAVDIGTFVKPGDLIATIDPTDSLTAYNQAQSDVSAANARVSQAQQTEQLQRLTAATAIAQAEAGVSAAQARYDQALQQAKVQPALTDAAIKQSRASLLSAQEQLRQLKTGSDPQARADVKSTLATAEANLANAELQVKRQESLLAKGFVSQSAVDQARTQRDVAKAQADAARVRGNTVGGVQTSLIAAAEARVAEARASLRSAEAQKVQIGLRDQDVANARAALLQARANRDTALANRAQVGIRAADIESAKAQIARSQAQFGNAKVQLESTTIRAPRAGVILQKYVEEGTIITSGQSFNSVGTSIVQIGDLSRIFVNAQVDEADIAQVAVGQKVKVTLDAFPDEDFEGRVRRIDPRGATDNNVTTIMTQVEILKPNLRLRPGLNSECEFVVAEKEGILSVPTRAVRNNKGKKFVLVLTAGPEEKAAPKDGGGGETGTTVEREVKTGLEAGDSIEIVSGLKEGDKVVTATIDPAAQKGSGGGGRPGGAPGGVGGGQGRPGGFGSFGR